MKRKSEQTEVEMEPLIFKQTPNKNPESNGFIAKFYRTSDEELMQIHLKRLQKIEGKRTIPNSFYETSISLRPKPKIHKKRKPQINIPDKHRGKRILNKIVAN